MIGAAMPGAAPTDPTAALRSTLDSSVRIRDLGQRLIESTRETVLVALELWEAMVDEATRQQQRVADETGLGWIASVADTQAYYAREFTRLVVEAARDAIE
jgi:hypothetical protein